jgi:hypothetical protein
MSLKLAKARYDYRLEELKRRFQRLLRRELTPREEKLLELSAPILSLDEDPRSEQDNLPPQAA